MPARLSPSPTRARPLLPALALLGFALVGCSADREMRRAGDEGDEASALEEPFPEKGKLAALGEAPPPPLLTEAVTDVARWELEGPLPERAGSLARAPQTEVERLLVGAIEEPERTRATEAMRCAARELGLVQLRTGAPASPRLQRFVLGRCGVVGSSVQVSTLAGDVPARVPEREIYATWGGQMKEMFEEARLRGAVDVGAALVRHQGKAQVTLVRGRREVDLEPTSLVPDTAGYVTLRGRVRLKGEAVLHAFVNRGELEAEACELDEEVAYPRFAVRCRVSPEDPSAWVVLSRFPEGRLVGNSLVLLVARPDGGDARVYEQKRFEAGEAERALPPRERAAAIINALRTRASLAPLGLATTQSQTADELAPHFVATLLGKGDDDERANEISLGMLAGWDVEGTIQGAEVGWALSFRGGSVEEMVSAALEYPGSRRVLMSPTADQLAFGLFADEGKAVGGTLFATYDLFDGIDPARASQRMWRSYNLARRDRGLEKARRLKLDRRLEQDLADEILDGHSPHRALRDLLEEASRVTGTRVQGWVFETLSLDNPPWPRELMGPEGPRASMVVSYRHPPESAWGHYVILVVVEDDGSLVAQGSGMGSGMGSGTGIGVPMRAEP